MIIKQNVIKIMYNKNAEMSPTEISPDLTRFEPYQIIRA